MSERGEVNLWASRTWPPLGAFTSLRPYGSPTILTLGSPKLMNWPWPRASSGSLHRVLWHLVGKGLFEEPAPGGCAERGRWRANVFGPSWL